MFENPEWHNESRVLGGLMELGDDAWFEFSWDVKYFDSTEMREIMQLILDQVDAGKPYDRFTVGICAKRKYGNADLFMVIMNCWEDKPFGLADLGYWHELLLESWQIRETALQAQIILANPEKMAEAVQAIADVNGVLESANSLFTVQEDFDKHLKLREDGVALMSTGEPAIDRLLLGGWRNGIYGIAGRPKQGKSMVMLHFARKLAEQGRNVLFVSYEMDKGQVYDRLYAAVLGIDSNLIAKNDLDSVDAVRLKNAKSLLPSSLVVENPVDRDVSDLYKLIQRTKQKLGGLDAVFVDYAQIMTLPKHKGNDAEMHSALSARLQQMVMQLDMPVITGLQLRKPVDVNERKVPGTSDIAGSDKYARDVVGIFYIIRHKIEGDDQFSSGSEMLLKLDTSRFTPNGSARFIAEDKFSRIVHKEWR